MRFEQPLFQLTRRRLQAGFLGVLAGVLVVFAAGISLFFEHALRERFDRQLVDFAHTAVASVDIEGGRFDFRSTPRPSDTAAADTLVQWFDWRGSPLRTLGAAGPGELTDGPPEAGRFQNWAGGWRSWCEAVYEPRSGNLVGYLRVVRPLGAIEENRRQLLWVLAAAIPAALLLSAAGGWWLTDLVIQPVEDTFRRLEQFTGDAGHELRSPLTAIMTNSAVALKYPEGMRPGDKQKFLLIEDASRQLLNLVQELLMLARSSNSGGQDARPVALAELTRASMAEFTPRAASQGLTLDYREAADGSNLWVRGKAEQLRCVLVNLLENAFKFTPPGGTITVSLARQEKRAWLTVADTGIGIAPADLPYIFDRFWQADRARRNRDGSGLGLAIARSIVEAHGGTISVESAPDRGSHFAVRLPLASTASRT